MSKVKTITICLPEDLVQDLKATADKLGISVSALVRIKLHSAPSIRIKPFSAPSGEV